MEINPEPKDPRDVALHEIKAALLDRDPTLSWRTTRNRILQSLAKLEAANAK